MDRILGARVLFVWLLMVLLRATGAPACTCIPERAASVEWDVVRARDNASVVFSGKVVEIRVHDVGLEARFDVERAWKGALAADVWVSTRKAGAACGFPFESGRRYLVYARGVTGAGVGRNPPFVTDICTRTRLLDAATTDLEPLTLVPSEVSLSGQVLDAAGRPISGVMLTIAGARLAGGERTTTADSRGRLQFGSVPPGHYRVTAELWDGHSGGEASFSVDGIADRVSIEIRRDPRATLTLDVADRDYLQEKR